MSTLTKAAMQLMGLFSPKATTGEGLQVIDLPGPNMSGGLPLMETLALRQSRRDFESRPLPYQVVSNLLWAAFGINRRDTGGRTAPSAVNCQEVDLYAMLPAGTYVYEPHSHSLQLVVTSDLRGATGYQDFVDEAPLNLLYVANQRRMKLVPRAHREAYAAAAAGAIAQNVYLFCASEGLATVIRAWIARAAIADALNLGAQDRILFAQTVGYPAAR